jgi:hypothetical protein
MEVGGRPAGPPETRSPRSNDSMRMHGMPIRSTKRVAFILTTVSGQSAPVEKE